MTSQVASMSLSMLSVVSKVHVVAHSFDLGVFVFRLALPIFDLFSFFYLCATILEPGSGQDVVFPGTSHRVSYLTAAWMVKLAVDRVRNGRRSRFRRGVFRTADLQDGSRLYDDHAETTSFPLSGRYWFDIVSRPRHCGIRRLSAGSRSKSGMPASDTL